MGHPIAVVGAGFAGLASAIFLRRAGRDVVVFERAEDLGPIGAGILIQPTGLRVLEKLGLRHAAEACGARVDAMRCKTRRGRVVFDLHYGTLEPGLCARGMHRGALFGLLLEAAIDAEIPIHRGVTVSHAREGHEGVALESDRGDSLGIFDYAVVANGARSALRDQLGLTSRARRYPWGALWFVGDTPKGLSPSALSQRVHGTRQMMGVLPTGQASQQDPAELASLFWSTRCSDVDRVRERGLEAFVGPALELMPEAAPLLEQLSDIEQLLFAEYWDVVLKRPYTDRCIVIGDAAHATSPQLGQGTNLALFDAMVFAECFECSADVQAVGPLFERQRRRHLRYYQWASRWLTPFFQSGWTPLAWLRDQGMPLAIRVPWLRRQMLETMAGTKVGLFRKSIRQDAIALPSDTGS